MAATITTTSTIAPAAATKKQQQRVPQPIRPSQGPLKSTWHVPEHKSSWKLHHWLIHLFGVDPIPQNATASTGRLGYLQPQASRDGIPDVKVSQVLNSLLMTAFFRPAAATLVIYNRDAPITLSPWLPLMIPAFSLAVDFWFYWYHRIMHESDALWKFHRTHHTAKHPIPVLSLYADMEQEWFDVVFVPLLAYFTLRPIVQLSYFDWMICWTHVMFVELIGHSGIRCAGCPPAFDLLPMKKFDVDLIIEDHDNHHSRGWKKSGNYGKQTRVWDRLFGTVLPRVETLDHLVDHSDKIALPQF